jgi:hypothetical protein
VYGGESYHNSNAVGDGKPLVGRSQASEYRQIIVKIEPTVSTPEPRPADAQQVVSRAELGDQPTAAHQGSTEPAPPIQSHRRKRRADSKESTQVDRSVANGFPADLNRQEL